MQVDHAGATSSLTVAREELKSAVQHHNNVVKECSAAREEALGTQFDQVGMTVKVQMLETSVQSLQQQNEKLTTSLKNEQEQKARLLASATSAQSGHGH